MRGFIDHVSELLSGYQNASDTLAGFMEYNQRSIGELLSTRRKIVETLNDMPAEAKLLLDEGGGEKIELTEEDKRSFVTAMRAYAGSIERYPHMLLNMGFIYLVALFDAFLADVFTSLLSSRPEVMKSGRQLTFERIIELVSEGPDSLIRFMAQSEIHRLSYASIAEQAEYYKTKFKIDLSDSGVGVGVLAEIRARRNLLVHNNGVVNKLYLDAAPSPPPREGEVLNVSYEYWEESQKNLNAVAIFIHKAVVDKFAPKDASA
jgi:hypothetical protein